MRVKAEMSKIVSRERGGDASNNKARDELIAEIVTVLNATVRHESGLEKEVANLKKSEEKLEKDVKVIAQKEGDLFALAYFELGVAVLAFAAVALVAVLRRQRGTSMSKAVGDLFVGLLVRKGGNEDSM